MTHLLAAILAGKVPMLVGGTAIAATVAVGAATMAPPAAGDMDQVRQTVSDRQTVDRPAVNAAGSELAGSGSIDTGILRTRDRDQLRTFAAASPFAMPTGSPAQVQAQTRTTTEDAAQDKVQAKTQTKTQAATQAKTQTKTQTKTKAQDRDCTPSPTGSPNPDAGAGSGGQGGNGDRDGGNDGGQARRGGGGTAPTPVP
jgi:hypothetical protein